MKKEKILNYLLKKRGFCWVTPKATVKKSPRGGKGVFAKEKIKKGEIVNISGGIVITEKEYKELEKKFGEFVRHYTLQISEGFYLICSLGENELEKDDFFNHSCNPNCGIVGQIVMVAMRDIEPGEELTYDYAMTDSDPDDFMVCHCGSKNCRKIITGNDWKNPKLQKKYQGFFASHIEEKIKTYKKNRKEKKALRWKR